MIPLIIILSVLIALYSLFFLENRRFRTMFTKCEHEKIKTGFRVVQISDLHDKRFGDRQRKIVSAIREAKPDYIAITGDLFNRRKHSACQNAFRLIHEVQKIAPVCFVEGNHEIAMQGTGERYMAQITEMGITVLRNSYFDFSPFRMVGLCQMVTKEQIAPLLSSERFNLVLSHRPELFDVYVDSGVDVVLCGHAHGGQVRLGHIGLYAPQQGLIPKYTSGWYRRRKTKMYVSRGLGNTIPFPRVFNTPELNVIDFIPKAKEN